MSTEASTRISVTGSQASENYDVLVGHNLLGEIPGILGQRTQRIAMVALAARDEVRALGLANLHKILARHFQCGFHRFRATGDEIHVRHAFGHCK